MIQALFDLSVRTALVTGSSRGLGRAIVEDLARPGARFVANGVDPARVRSANHGVFDHDWRASQT
jgi:gluconate 5-dehydrogenase